MYQHPRHAYTFHCNFVGNCRKEIPRRKHSLERDTPDRKSDPRSIHYFLVIEKTKYEES